MAIIKDFVTGQGVTATYHKIKEVNLDCANLMIRFDIQVYATAAARTGGYGMLWMEQQFIPFSAFTQDPRDLLYPVLEYFGDSYLRGGVADAEGSGAPGNFSINLTSAALIPTVVTVP
jgi:hypothetical protein